MTIGSLFGAFQGEARGIQKDLGPRTNSLTSCPIPEMTLNKTDLNKKIGLVKV